MNFRVLYRKPGPRWRAMWHHNTENSSWWSDEIIEADSAEEAAGKVLKVVDYEKHTSWRRPGMKVRVFGPIPEDYEEFIVAPSTDVKVVTAS